MKYVIQTSIHLIIIMLFLICSCNPIDQEKQVSYIKIENNIILEDTANDIIPLKCSSNFPPETFVVIKSGLRLNVTDQDLLANTFSCEYTINYVTVEKENASIEIPEVPFELNIIKIY